MAKSKPTHGYFSRTDAVVALKKAGLSTRQISEKLGLPVKTVSALECSARRWRTSAPKVSGGELIGSDIKRLYRSHAMKRGLSVENLIRKILRIVVEDNMVDAVLDDSGEIAA